jgi:arylsulfatase A-like enzyme
MNVGFGGERFIPSRKLITFTQYVKSIGYQTAGFVSAAPLRKGMGLEAGFQVWTEMKPKTRERKAERTVSDWLRWFNTREEKPFFSWIHLYDAHNPFQPPIEYQTMFTRDADLAQWSAEREIPKRSYRNVEGPAIPSKSSEEQYAGEIRYMDDQLGRVFQALRDQNEWDRTILIITADHGEGLGQHNAPGHGGLLWHEQLHVPLIIRSPYHEPRRISDIAWSVNIFPTVLDLVPLVNSKRFLRQATEGSELQENSRSVTLAEVGEGHRAVSTERWKYIAWSDETHSLFDRLHDPFELVDIAHEREEKANKLHQILRKRVIALKKRGKELGGGETEKLGTEQFELLRALGYVDEDPQAADLPASVTEDEQATTENERKRSRPPKWRGKARPRRGR